MNSGLAHFQDDLLKVVQDLNENPEVHGILVQLPLPSHINEERILSAISIEKDVDGFHPLNIGKLAMKGRTPLFVPCTPKGCIELLDRYHVEISGKNAVVIGRSNIVGIPVAMLLLNRNATVTICHTKTENLKAVCKEADILVAAAGKAKMLDASFLKEGAVLIDVGINVDENGKLCGDVLWDGLEEKASAATPVPGGVGAVTTAVLAKHLAQAACRKRK